MKTSHFSHSNEGRIFQMMIKFGSGTKKKTKQIIWLFSECYRVKFEEKTLRYCFFNSESLCVTRAAGRLDDGLFFLSTAATVHKKYVTTSVLAPRRWVDKTTALNGRRSNGHYDRTSLWDNKTVLFGKKVTHNPWKIKVHERRTDAYSRTPRGDPGWHANSRKPRGRRPTVFKTYTCSLWMHVTAKQTGKNHSLRRRIENNRRITITTPSVRPHRTFRR